MFENKLFFPAQTYTSTQQLKDPEIFPHALLGLVLPRMPCPMQFFESGKFVWIDPIDVCDLFNKPVWTKLNELPDSLSPKKLESIYIYILFLEQSNYHEYHGKLACQTFPSARLKSLKHLTKELRSWEKYFSFRLIHLHKTYKKRTCVICLPTTSLLLSISGISVAISGIPGSHVSGGFSSAC